LIPIKYKSAREQSLLKRWPVTFDFFLSHLNRELIDSLTAHQLAMVIDATYLLYKAGVQDGRAMED